MMTNLDKLIDKAIRSEGHEDDVSKVYLAVIESEFFVPTYLKEEIQESNPVLAEQEFVPLYLQADDHYFLLAFDTLERLQQWAGEHVNAMEFTQIHGADLIRGIGEKVILAVNYDSTFYKEFLPDEIKQLKKIVLRLDNWKKMAAKSNTE